MRLPRIRIRTLMSAVAVIAATLAVEQFFFRLACSAVRSHGDDFIPSEAWEAWGFLNVITIGFVGGAAFFARTQYVAVPWPPPSPEP